MNRGEVWDVDWPGVGRHPVVIVTRQVAIPLLTNVTVALVTSTVRDLPAEVLLDERHGLDCESVVNCDNLLTVPKTSMALRRGSLGVGELEALAEALAIALELD
ncbi:MAG: type II toxin-antitoxin system PemK/MazF family toxin [Thermoleophilaceae bacterium]|nr:type II toxin-antitoxin system PemK/MazF family toxin [Thermoleophilaceae bacterium]